MAVNSFNPRLFSSSSSENDVDDVFRHKGASVAPVAGSLPNGKSRCFSEPVYQNGKEAGKDDSKVFARTPALSDSSNVLRRQRGRVSTFTESESTGEYEVKSDFSPIMEDVSHTNLEKADKSPTESVFPEPESIRREAPSNTYRFSILEEEEESMDEMNPTLAMDHDLEEADISELYDELNNEDLRMRPLENDVFYMRDVAFGSTDGDVGSEDQQTLEVYDDESYPEKEQIPPGYISYSTQEPSYTTYPWEVPHTVLPEYSDLDLDRFPELPDDLIKDTDVYPVDFGSLSPALVPPSPFGPPPDVKLKMKLLFGDDC